MTETYIVLGMHRARTSLVSAIVSKLGVSMTNVHTRHYGTYKEDQDFLNLNRRVLRMAGGKWHNPPSAKRIWNTKQSFRKEIVGLVAKRQHKRWGWKDPRNCLTWQLYTPHLVKPRFIVVERNREEICKSLLKRDKGQRQQWMKLIARYQKGIELMTRTKWPRLHIDTGMLVDRATVDPVLGKLAEFLGVEDSKWDVLPLIRFRK